MTKPSAEENAKAIAFLLVIIFVAGGYLIAWLTIQKILFFQTMFWISFWIALLSILSAIGFFIAFLIKEENHYFDSWSSDVFEKSTLGWISLISVVLFVISFFIMLNAYQNGFSDEAMQNLAKAQGKLDEFNYIRDVLTGVEIERLMVEGFNEAMQGICDSNQNYDCDQLKQNYQSVRDILEAKEKADSLMRAVRLIEK